MEHHDPQQQQELQNHQDLQEQPQQMEETGLYPEHTEYDTGEELSLDMLKDSPPGQKPLYPFSTLIRCAIKGSPGGKLLLEDIYYCLEKRFEYFRTVAPGWKNTIRHTLSLHPSFEKVPRPLTDRGKGCYWTINEIVDPRIGVQRVRKKKDPAAKRGGRRTIMQQHQDGIWYGDALGGPPRVGAGQFGYTQFDAEGNPYPLQVPPQYSLFLAEDAYEPEIAPDGEPDWHAIWKNELRRLRHATIEQMRAGAGPDWYKMMAETVRGAFMLPPLPPANTAHEAMQGVGEPVDGVGLTDPNQVMPGQSNEELGQSTMI